MAAPCVLVTSCLEDLHPNELIKQILGVDELPVGEHLLESIQAYPWHLNTKYYTADLLLCTTDKKTIGDQPFAEAVEAFIVYFDADNEKTFELVKSWLPFLKQIAPEVQLLVCQHCDVTSAIPRSDIMKWCVENVFELVELTPEEEDEEDDFLDSYGIKRIIQALQAHTWPNLIMKDRPSIRSPYFQQLMKEQAEENALNEQRENSTASGTAASNPSSESVCQCENSAEVSTAQGVDMPNTTAKTSESSVQEQKMSTRENILDDMLGSDDMALFSALGDDDPGGESFEKLFENLRIMKERADTLPEDQRKNYAEKVAVSFWRAIGGDEDEIGTLSDSDN